MSESDQLRHKSGAAGRRVDAYLDTIGRMEQDIAMVDHDAAMASIAISLKRIADAVTYMATPPVMVDDHMKRIADALDSTIIADRLSDAIYNAVTQAALGIQRR
jgi:hypothetical protein